MQDSYDDTQLQIAIYQAVRLAVDHAKQVFERRVIERREERIGIFVTSLRQHLSAFVFSSAQDKIEFETHKIHLCNVNNWSDAFQLGTRGWLWRGNNNTGRWIKGFLPLEKTMNRDRLVEIVESAVGESDFNPVDSLATLRRIVADAKMLNTQVEMLNAQAAQESQKLYNVAESLEQPANL